MEIHERTPDLAPHYRSLIPLTKPGAGEQYAFEVSLDRCTGCKACVSACHSLNGLDDHEAWLDTALQSFGIPSSLKRREHTQHAVRQFFIEVIHNQKDDHQTSRSKINSFFSLIGTFSLRSSKT